MIEHIYIRLILGSGKSPFLINHWPANKHQVQHIGFIIKYTFDLGIIYNKKNIIKIDTEKYKNQIGHTKIEKKVFI